MAPPKNENQPGAQPMEENHPGEHGEKSKIGHGHSLEIPINSKGLFLRLEMPKRDEAPWPQATKIDN